MQISKEQQQLLRNLPGVDHILELTKKDSFFDSIPRSVLTNSIRSVIDEYRNLILKDSNRLTEKVISDDSLLRQVQIKADQIMAHNLRRTVNATGIVVHTNLGRSLLADEAVNNLNLISSRYSNLEFDLTAGRRGSRYSAVEEVICEITGAEAALVVNNNAGAVLIALETLAKGRKVIVSRGELVEIGGSFRIPDVMSKSGGILHEVGTTNRTHLRDYADAIDEDTALLLKVHKSNYSVVGFSAEVALKDLVELGNASSVPVMEDLGSGTFIDFSRYGLVREPTVQESVASGAHVITFSGDKLLGGPQAGIIVGKKEYLERIKKNPINRALRIDKMTLAALESTLRMYRDPEKAVQQIPTLRMLTQSPEQIQQKARHLISLLEEIGSDRLEITEKALISRAGGGSLPLLELPSRGIGLKIKGLSANVIERTLRANIPPIIGRIEDDTYILDLRTIQEDEPELIQSAFDALIRGLEDDTKTQ